MRTDLFPKETPALNARTIEPPGTSLYHPVREGFADLFPRDGRAQSRPTLSPAREESTMRQHPNTQHIGNAHGRIAIWCNESEAFDIAAKFPYPDKFSEEIGRAVALAYPPEESNEE